MAVMSHGQDVSATAPDRADLHRAVDALIALHIAQGDPLKASIFASLQNIYYSNENAYDAALAASRQALDLQQKSGFRENLDLQWAAVGKNLMSLGRFDEAFVALRKAQSFQSGKTTSSRAAVWRDIILAAIRLGRPELARHEATLFLTAAASGPSSFRAEARIAESDVLMAEGRHAEAVAAVRRAVEIAGSDSTGERIRLEALAQLMVCVIDSMRILPYDQAMELARRMDTEVPGLLFPVAPFAQRAVHVRRRLAGEFDAMLRDEVDARRDAQRAGNRDGEISALRSMAATYAELNSHDNEIAALTEAVGLARERAATASAGVARNLAITEVVDLSSTLGQAYLAAERPKQADESFSASIDLAASADDRVNQSSVARELGEAWLGRARAAIADGRPLEAAEILDRALAGTIAEARFDEADLFIVRARAEPRDAEHLRSAAGWFDRAVSALRAERNATRETWAHLSAVRFFIEAAQQESAADRVYATSVAAEHLGQARVLTESLRLAGARWRIAFYEGLLAEIRADDAAATASYRLALEELDRLRSSLAAGERVALIDELPVETLFEHALGVLVKSGQRDSAWELLERAKARTFVEMLQGRRSNRVHHKGKPVDVLAGLEQRILDVRVALAPENAAALRGSGRNSASLEQTLRALEQQLVFARDQLPGDEGNAREILAHPLSLETIQRRLSADSALIEYGFLPAGITAFVVTHASIRQLSWTTSVEACRTGISELRAALADPESDAAALGERTSRISAHVVHPVLDALGPDIKRLIIVPAGPLYYVPFQALTTRDGVSLIDRYEITYLPNATSLEALEDTVAPDGSLFVGALGALSADGLEPLPGTLDEAREIASIEPEACVITGTAFTRAAVLDALQRDTVVHLATHSIVDEDAPMLSAILTAPEGGQASRVSLYDVMDLDLTSKLVVLSACETGLGRLRRGDEIAGLTRTFLIAGAKTVVSSLWEVSDAATALLMRGFYEGLHDGRSPGASLRAAALGVREWYPHPAYWAPFVVTGAR